MGGQAAQPASSGPCPSGQQYSGSKEASRELCWGGGGRPCSTLCPLLVEKSVALVVVLVAAFFVLVLLSLYARKIFKER